MTWSWSRRPTWRATNVSAAARPGRQTATRPRRARARLLAAWLCLASLAVAGGGGATTRDAGNRGPLGPAAAFRTVRLDGGKLYGVAVQAPRAADSLNAKAAVRERLPEVPFDVNVRVKKGQFRWYDRLTAADELFSKGQFARAFHAYDEVIATPDFDAKYRPAVLLSAAQTLAAQNRDLEAQRLATAAFEDSPSPETATALRFFAGLLAARAANWDYARQLYLRVLADSPQHMDALSHLAMLEFIVGDLEAFQSRFLHFIRVQSIVAEKRQSRLFQTVNHSYQSSFRKDKLGQDMTAWLVNHALHSLSIDGAPSRLAAAALAGDAGLEGYLPGALEANCVLVYTAYTRTLIAGTRFEAQGADINRGLLHFNLAQRLRHIGAWGAAAWHLDFAASLDGGRRRGILSLHAALQTARAVAWGSEDDRARGAADVRGRLAAIGEDHGDAVADSARHCMALSASLAVPASALRESESLLRAVAASCDLAFAPAAVPTQARSTRKQPQGEETRVGVFCGEYFNSTSGRMLVPLLRAMALQHERFGARLVLFSWPLQPFRRYLVNPSMLVVLDPLDANAAADTIRREELDELIFVDAHRDLRVWLLSKMRDLAPRVRHWHLSGPSRALAHIPSQTGARYLLALLDDLWRWSSPPAQRSTPPDAIIQGQLFLAEELYFLVAGAASDVDPGFDPMIEALHALHSSTVIVFIGDDADESPARAVMWKRFARRRIDPGRVRFLRRMPRHEFLAFLETIVDVVVEPIRPSGGSLFVLLEALRLGVPVVACEQTPDGQSGTDESARGAAGSRVTPLLRALGVSAFSVAASLDAQAALALRLTGSISAERSTFVKALRARFPRGTEQQEDTFLRESYFGDFAHALWVEDEPLVKEISG